ncbi:Villin/Gelsolin [Carpediemonas membranifera]|uniref:Villin/Gelsolin n=1 Tax=Carpediemonas membranifera TaxID=201153 RepID=A0A8J6E3N7_9EUKA|nr:Villin/Gelsolin [Carpediemonas membranifera]|eukprot:KAG9396173.1 Villin/Gelsolin [Carpediemonas membranifera]
MGVAPLPEFDLSMVAPPVDDSLLPLPAAPEISLPPPPAPDPAFTDCFPPPPPVYALPPVDSTPLPPTVPIAAPHTAPMPEAPPAFPPPSIPPFPGPTPPVPDPSFAPPPAAPVEGIPPPPPAALPDTLKPAEAGELLSDPPMPPGPDLEIPAPPVAPMPPPVPCNPPVTAPPAQPPTPQHIPEPEPELVQPQAPTGNPLGLTVDETNQLLLDLQQKPTTTVADVFDGVGLDEGLQIWVIDGLVPREIPETEHGLLYSSDAYIVLSTVESDNGTDYELFQWAGRDATMDKTGAVAAWTVQIASYLAELSTRCVQRLEVDGEESNEFIAILGGIEHREGSCATKSGLRKPVAEVPKLYHVIKTGKGVKIISRDPTWTSLPCVDMPEDLTHSNGSPVRFVDHGLVWDEKKHGDVVTKYAGVFILQHGKSVFLYTPPAPPCRAAKTVERARQMEVAATIQEDVPGARLVVVGETEEEDAPFWAALGGKPTWDRLQPLISTKNAARAEFSESNGDYSEDEGEASDDGPDSTPESPELVRVDFSTGQFGIKRVDKDPAGHYTRAMLAPDGVYLLFTDLELFVWTGNKARALEVSGALHAATEVLGPEQGLHVERVIPSIEPVTFTAHFPGWRKVLLPSEYRVVESKIAQSVPQIKVDTKMMHTPPAAPEHPTSPPEGMIRCYRISDSLVEAVEPELFGHFFSKDVIVVCVDNTQKPLDVPDRSFHIFVWVGRDASPLPVLTYKQVLMGKFAAQVESTGGGRPMHHWERMGSESAEFKHLFASTMVVHSGGKSTLFIDHTPAPPTPCRLYQVGGWPYAAPCAREVAAKFTSLNSRDCFLIVVTHDNPARPAAVETESKTVIVLWRGKFAPAALANAAFDLAEMFIRDDDLNSTAESDDDSAKVITENEGEEGPITVQALSSPDQKPLWAQLYPSPANGGVVALERDTASVVVEFDKALKDGGFDHLMRDDLREVMYRADKFEEMRKTKSYPTLAQNAGEAFIPRLFRLSAISGCFDYDRIIPIQQVHLDSTQIYMLDTYSHVYLWGDPTHHDYAKAEDLVREYISQGMRMDGRERCDVVPATPGAEPVAFVCCFPGWNDRAARAFVDPYAKRSAEAVQRGFEARQERIFKRTEHARLMDEADRRSGERIFMAMST